MALDIFHAHQGIECLDDFEIEVIDEDGRVIEQDPDHVDYSASDDGEVEKISGKPVPEHDLKRQRHLSADQGGALNDNWPAGATVKLESRTIYGTKVGNVQWAYRDETGQLMSLKSRMPLDTLRYSAIEERTPSEPRLFEGEWNHLFGPGRAETRCRIVVDVASDKLVAAQAFDGVKWVDLSRAEREDLADSLFNANEISVAPEQSGLSSVGSLPPWAPPGNRPGSASQRPEVADTASYESGKKYSGRIPEIKYLPVSAIERREMDFRPEVMVVSEEVAANMDYSQPIEVTAFRYGKANDDTVPVVTLQDGHHRTAAAIQTGREYLPVEVRAINAKGEKLAALIAMSQAIEARLGIDDRKLSSVDQEATADRAFADYDFGSGVTVTDTGAWEYSTPGYERTRKVYVETEPEDDGPAPRSALNFTVRFDLKNGSLVEAYAIDRKGQIWGSLPREILDTTDEAGQDKKSETVTAWSLRSGDRIVTRNWPEGRLIVNTEPGLPRSTKIRVTYEGNGEFEDREVFGASDAVIVRRKLAEEQLTSRKLAEQFPVKGSMPQAVVHQLYRLREAEVTALSQRSVIVESDLGDLDRGARAVVAGLLYAKCDERARQALLNDEHPHVRSCAAISGSDLVREPEHNPSPSFGM